MKKLTILLLVSALMCVSAGSNVQAQEERVIFQSDKHSIASYYKPPNSKGSAKGVVLFVHGDGAMPYDAHGYYNPIWQEILDSGYAIFSWDKLGVGNSTGNWLQQSMQDRQREVRAAITFVKETYGYKEGQIGLMGFSQAGWVVPAVTKDNPDIGFMIGIGFAMNWMDQSWYLTRMHLQQKGTTDEIIAAAYQKHLRDAEFWKGTPTYDAYIKNIHKGDETMSQDRFNFARKNALSDATKDYEGITQPILILLGDHDLNVNTQNTEAVLTDIFNTQDNAHIQILPKATHALLKHPEFSTQNPDIYFLLKLMWQGKDAYAPPFFNTLTNWLNNLDQKIE